MAGFLAGVRRKIAEATTLQPGSFTLAGRSVKCNHCGNGVFTQRSSLLNTVGRRFSNPEASERTSSVLICERCGMVHWFTRRPERR